MRKRCLCTASVCVPVVGLVALVIQWWLRWRREEARPASEAPIVIRVRGPDEGAAGEETATAQRTAMAQGTAAAQGAGAVREGDAGETAPDDLSEVEGIGPRIRQVFADAGVLSFSDLASTTVPQLKGILLAAGVRLAYPDTWAEQAALAAAGDWDGLRTLQATLYRGWRIEESPTREDETERGEK